jgi:predicted DNA-binding transcriptional regulator
LIKGLTRRRKKTHPRVKKIKEFNENLLKEIEELETCVLKKKAS